MLIKKLAFRLPEPSTKKNNGIALFFATTTLAAFAACDMNSYVPSAKVLLDPNNPTAAFIVDEQTIIGIYGNIDVDSVIYAYTTSLDEEDFWQAIDTNVSDSQWTHSERHEDFRRYVRYYPKTKRRAFHSIEEARVGYQKETKRIVVAWVQTDHFLEPDGFPRDGPEGGFAETTIWPRFEKEIENHGR